MNSFYDYAQVKRLKDKASPAYITLSDRIRSWRVSWNSRIKAGKDVVFKRDVKIYICKTGELIIGNNALFHENCYLLLTMPHPRVEIGEWVFIGRNTIIASKNSIKIGDYTLLAPNCYIIDHEHGFSKNDIIHNQRSIMKEVVIGRDCFLGTGSIVLGGVTVGDGAVIGAGSVVTKNIPPYEIWAGNPAKFIKNRI